MNNSGANSPRSVASNATTLTQRSNLNNAAARFEVFKKTAFIGENAAKKANRHAKGLNAYRKKLNATRKTWLASHGMPRNVPAAEAARINKEAREYAMKLYGRNVPFAGGKRKGTRKGRKAGRRTRRR